MILISNNVGKYMRLPKDAIIRVNMAWIKTVEDLDKILIKNNTKKVFLDYPQGRSKPPKPTLTLEQGYEFCAKYPNINYFAVSNIEQISNIKEIQAKLPTHVEFVPKIETLKGVKNLTNIVYDCGIKTLMLDKEDLYLDVKKNNDEFFKCIELTRGICEGLNVNLLELEGVVFVRRTK